MRHRERPSRSTRPGPWAWLGSSALAVLALGAASGIALADECVAGDDTASCQPTDPDTASAQATSGEVFGESLAVADDDSSRSGQSVDDPEPETGTPSVGDATENDRGAARFGVQTNSTAISRAEGNQDGEAAATVTAARRSESRATAQGAGTKAAAAAAEDSRAISRATGSGAGSSAAAADNSSADAASIGLDAFGLAAPIDNGPTSGASANDGSRAFSRAIGPGATARSSANDDVRSFALAGPFSTADVSGGHSGVPAVADCDGLVALGVTDGRLCAGPIDDVPVPRPPHGAAGEDRPGDDHAHGDSGHRHYDDCAEHDDH